MPLRNPKPISWRPAGCSDALDGSEAFDGAMAKLQDLVPSQQTNRNWVCRPAATLIANIGNGNPISATFIVGDVLYGMISNGLGQDVPFSYNLATNTSIPVTNLSAAQNPTTQPTSGDWTPITFAQIGSRVVVTHPGMTNAIFNTGRAASWTAALLVGSNLVQGGLTPAQVGDSLFGAGIPAGTTISTISNGPIGGAIGTASGTAGANTITFGAITGGSPQPGLSIHSGTITGLAGIITDVTGSVITYTGENPATFSSGTVRWSGSVLTMSANATASSPSGGETINSAAAFPDPSGASRKFGWFDISNASIQLQATLALGSSVISLTSAFGIQPGMAVSLGATSLGTLRTLNNFSFSATGTPPDQGDGTLTIFVTDPTKLPQTGMVIAGPGITTGAQVASSPQIINFVSGTYQVSVPLSFPATGAAGLSTGTYAFTGLIVGVVSGTSPSTGVVTLTFTGGTPTAPTWSVGDTSYNPLPSVPVAVTTTPWGAAMFACGVNGLPYSDSLLAAQRTFASQALVAGDGLAITALGALPLNSPISGGIIEAVIAFAGVSRMYQVTGAPALGTLSIQPMNVATGTLAPLSITPTNFGLAFISPEGMRIVEFSGQVSDPIGDAGRDQGISFVFISTITPSRIVGAANADTIRFTVVNNINPGIPTYQEWAYDITRKRWYGPMTSSYLAMQPWRHTFVGVPRVATDSLANGSLLPTQGSSYIEFGVQLTYQAQTVLLPDNPDEQAFGVNESSVWVSSNPATPVQFAAIDDNGTFLDVVSLNATVTPRQRLIPQDKQWVFRQMALQIGGQSNASVTIGRINLRYQELGYPLPSP